MSFNKIFDIVERALTQSQYQKDMLNVKEDSPWHREENVWCHTRMTLDWYRDNLQGTRTPEQQFMTKMALLFHDTGKPTCRELKMHPERGMVYRYPAHELRSARIFEDFIIENDFFRLFTPKQFVNIKWMIEHHLPYDLKTQEQLSRLHVDAVSRSECLKQAFCDMVMSDAHGRISDDSASKLEKCHAWIVDFTLASAPEKTRDVKDGHVMWVLVGASGSGKSTLTKSRPNFSVVSLDQYRLDFYEQATGEIDYGKAWTYCNENAMAFDKYWKADFVTRVKAGEQLIVDNTNTSRKARRFWITMAKDHGYIIASMEFPNALSTVITRQVTRGDKCVPEEVVRRQYYGTTTPAIGYEVDAAFMVDSDGETHVLGASESYYRFK